MTNTDITARFVEVPTVAAPTYRACTYVSPDGQGETVLTGRDQAHLDDEDLLAAAEAEALEAGIASADGADDEALSLDDLRAGLAIVDDWRDTGQHDAPETLGDRVAHLRDLAGLTQREAAERSGMVQPSWARIESGGRDDSAQLGTLRRLRGALGCSWDELLGE